MSSAIPSSMSFEMLSRLPPQSFQLQYREFRPDLEPNGGKYDAGRDHRASIHMRGAPNEMILNTGCDLSASVLATYGSSDTTPVTHNLIATTKNPTYTDWNAVQTALSLVPPVGNNSILGVAFDSPIISGVGGSTTIEAKSAVAVARNSFINETVQEYLGKINRKWRYGSTWINSSRESFNQGALPFLDNQDSVLHLRNNVLRGKCAKRSVDVDNCVDDLTQAGFCFEKFSQGIALQVVVNQYANAGTLYGNPTTEQNVRSKAISIPLGMYSSLVNSHSVVPIGLMSSYGVNGWAIDFSLASNDTDSTQNSWLVDIPDKIYDKSVNKYVPNVAETKGINYYRNVRITVPIVKILDPAVMEAVLSLYEKREMVPVGGAQFPMSLRMNSIGYRTFTYPLRPDQGDYFIRLASTDRSVRAIAWQIVDRTASSTIKTGIGGVNALRVTRIGLKSGSIVVFDPVEDREPDDCNVQNFLGHQHRRSDALFSPFPYYQEAIHHANCQNDNRGAYWSPSLTTSDYDQYGVISLENLDHREPEYSGSFQASGYDLTGVGGLDLELRISRRGVNAQDALLHGPANSNYTITFLMAYDVVHEISPSGVIDITNAVL